MRSLLMYLLGAMSVTAVAWAQQSAPPPCEDRLATLAQYATMQRTARDQAEAQLAEARAALGKAEASAAKPKGPDAPK